MKRQNNSLLSLEIFVIVCILMISLTGCSAIRDKIAVTKGELIGNHFEVSTFDHLGNKTLTVDGSKITVGLFENDANIDETSTGYGSSVLEITVNGKQLLQVGNTVILQKMD